MGVERIGPLEESTSLLDLEGDSGSASASSLSPGGAKGSKEEEEEEEEKAAETLVMELERFLRRRMGLEEEKRSREESVFPD